MAGCWLLAGCQQDVTATAVPQQIPTLTPQPTLTETAISEPTPPPTVTNTPTAVPLPAITLEPPQGRAQLITLLQQVQTDVIGLVQTQQQLLTFPRPDDPEWAEDVAVQAAFIQANRLALESLVLPAAGESLMVRLQTAVHTCEQAAQAQNLDALATCLSDLQMVSVSFGNGSGGVTVNPNVVTPISLVGCSQTSVGLVPLTDLGTDLYMGQQGGLYPNGQNEPPATHLAAGLAQAQTIQPLAADGSPAADGKIGFISVGMSNASLEFNSFLRLANDDPDKSDAVVIVNGAQGGWTSNKLAENPEAEYWQVLDERLTDNGLTPTQVQVVWLKQARGGVKNEPFPQEPQILQAQLQSIVQIVQMRYPNVKIIYLSSRIYGGYATGPLNPEPIAYHSGFAVKWLIEAQINGEPQLNYDPNLGAVTAPWLAWGPYLWADGLTPRSDGLTWACNEFADDGTHPGTPARDKVAAMLLDFLKTDETVRAWFFRDG
ncbi:hypothetical protein [Candidatus Leptofilum sp.]|uniref:hypothetical protein n=1 Tax=Candidatus Leptofilum sp. TaxID=3241576 RepID=UPI003B59C6B6